MVPYINFADIGSNPALPEITWDSDIKIETKDWHEVPSLGYQFWISKQYGTKLRDDFSSS